MEAFEFSAQLIAGAGCVAGFPVVCGDPGEPLPVDVSLGDRGDVADVNSFISSTTMQAGSGNDDVLAGGFDASATGGSGDDTIRLAANDRTTGDGGSGRDRISGGLGAAAATLDGGSGGDLLVPDGFAANRATGGTGDDRLVAFRGGTVELFGQAGDDVILARSGGVTVNGGADEDTIDVRGSADSAPDTVRCGSGFDVAFVNAGDSVARDCELVLKRAPTARKVADAEADARALLAHFPDPQGA
jgi:Ca2+-binding RTX toxin-like protein